MLETQATEVRTWLATVAEQSIADDQVPVAVLSVSESDSAYECTLNTRGGNVIPPQKLVVALRRAADKLELQWMRDSI
jgi:hypothetical protein